MADKFVKKFGTEAHPLKIGKSFEKKSDSAYHSIRYDFKPGSIDEERKGSLEVSKGLTAISQKQKPINFSLRLRKIIQCL